jgi:glutamine amidotransferase
MQLLTTHSEEGDCAGLGWIDADTRKFNLEKYPSLKIPHMGWTDVRFIQANALCKAPDREQRFYFVHSYHVHCRDTTTILAQSTYGEPFTCGIHKENIYGVQFHPEKSHRFGMELLTSFYQHTH